ncbi:MAG: 16S rRNA (guanine(527)-N(7))-methyltransferase RsmG [Butyrivibrio sp.]
MDNFLKENLICLGENPTEKRIDRLNRFYELLIEKNKVMNLTAITEYKDVVIKHFIDSLAVEHAHSLSDCKSVIDVGTGAGFPGMVLKIFNEDTEYTLLDSLNKRINFLKEVKEELHLEKLSLLHGRAEDYARMPEYREQFDACVSRAVANLATLAEYCLPFVKKDGYFIAYKAGDCKDEVEESKKAIFLLGGKIENVVLYDIPNSDITRAFVVIRKISNISQKYPRKAGLPSKEPLK